MGENSPWDLLIENVDVSGVITVPLECDCDTVLMVVTVLDSVTVAVDSLRGRAGECGSEWASACNSSIRCEGDGSRA